MNEKEYQEYGQAMANAASGTGGPKIGGGAIVIGAILLAIICGVTGGPAFKIGGDLTEASKARAKAEEQTALAQVKAAEAERVKIENEKIIKEAEAKVLTDYSEVAKAAIGADRRRAHPEEMFGEWLQYGFLCCLSVVALAMVLLVVFAVGNPKGFDSLIAVLKGAKGDNQS
jgi:hypothetical protein